MRLPTSLVCAVVLVGAPVVAGAQEPTSIQPGSRIRLSLVGGDRIIGTFLRREGDSLEVQPKQAGSRAIALAQVRKLEASAGKRHPIGKWLLIGTGIGAGAGALGGYALPPCPDTDATFEGAATELTCVLFLRSHSRGENALVWGTLGAATGALTGLVVGAMGQENWIAGTLPGWRPVVAAWGRGVHLGFEVRVGPSRAGRARGTPTAP